MRVLFFLCLFFVAIYSAAAQRPPYYQCPPTYVLSPCGGKCLRTCDNQNPTACLERQCVPGCVCPEGTVQNRFGECVQPVRCMER